MSKYPVSIVDLNISSLVLIHYAGDLHHLPSGRDNILCCLRCRHAIWMGRANPTANLDASYVYADISVEVEASCNGLGATNGDGDWLCTSAAAIKNS